MSIVTEVSCEHTQSCLHCERQGFLTKYYAECLVKLNAEELIKEAEEKFRTRHLAVCTSCLDESSDIQCDNCHKLMCLDRGFRCACHSWCARCIDKCEPHFEIQVCDKCSVSCCDDFEGGGCMKLCSNCDDITCPNCSCSCPKV